MKLIIRERPSVAQSIAAVLGAKQHGDGYLEGEVRLTATSFRGASAILRSWQAPMPNDEKYEKWRRGDLPILPENWRFTVSRDKQKQFDILRFFKMNCKII